jgi:hypothetical protein
MVCPKCGTEQAAATACRRCGLLRARFADARVAADEAVVPPDAMAAGLWAHAARDFADLKAHEAFVNHCQASGQIAHAAARYRQARIDRGAEAEPAAGAMLERIGKLAALQLTVSAHPDGAKRRARKTLMTVVLVVMLVTGVIVLILLMQKTDALRHRPSPDVDEAVPVIEALPSKEP